ncbi:hypothetical protein PENSPDRAFT_749825 [Peniophora sp. CONT]|nr:hypothetical protein PENSPDRAFT_749825 [Peniophora sp. CONT]
MSISSHERMKIQIIVAAALALVVQWYAVVSPMLSPSHETVYSFFAYRVYLLGHKQLIIPTLILCTAIAQSVLGILYGIEGLSVPDVRNNASGGLPSAVAALASKLLCDCIIATAMVYYHYRSRSMVPTTNRVIRSLIKYALSTGSSASSFYVHDVLNDWHVIPTGLLEALCTLPCILLFVTLTHTMIYAPFYFFLARLYSCSLLCSLNNRDHLRDLNNRNNAITVSTFRVAQDPYGEATGETRSMSCEENEVPRAGRDGVNGVLKPSLLHQES